MNNNRVFDNQIHAIDDDGRLPFPYTSRQPELKYYISDKTECQMCKNLIHSSTAYYDGKPFHLRCVEDYADSKKHVNKILPIFIIDKIEILVFLKV